MKGVEGVARFLARVWRLIMDETQTGAWALSPRIQDVAPDKQQERILHATIKKVTEDLDALAFNTAISQMMVFVNAFTNAPAVPKSAMCTFLVLLNPFAPHISSELWEKMCGRGSDITAERWPKFDEALLVEDEVEIVFQVNGKLRDKARAPLDADDKQLEEIARSNARVQEFIAGKQVRKVVVVRNRLVNIVVG
jgi:leucyl-tRNA synthetase